MPVLIVVESSLPSDAFILGDLVEREANRLGYRDTGTLGAGRCAPIATSRVQSRPSVLGRALLLVFGFRDAFLVLEFAGFFEFILKLSQSALIVGLRLRVEHLARMPEVAREHSGSREVFGTCAVRDFFAGSACASRQVERADLLAGMREQMRDVMEPLCVLESCGLAFIGDGPDSRLPC